MKVNSRHTVRPWSSWILAPMLLVLAARVRGDADEARVNRANWKLADKFTPEHLRQFIYDAAVAPNWINSGDTSGIAGATARVTLTFNKAGDAFTFVVENKRFEYRLEKETLKDLGAATPPGPAGRAPSR